MVKTALLVMDVQGGIVKMLGDEAENYLARTQKIVDVARSNKIPVYFIVVRFRSGYPEVSPSNKSFSKISSDASRKMDDASEATSPVIEPLAGEPVIAKKRVSAFAGSDLEMILRAQKIEHLVLCGIATSGVVLSTLRQAADTDYQLTVLKDCCFDNDVEVHSVLIEKVFPKQAEVITGEEWEKQL